MTPQERLIELVAEGEALRRKAIDAPDTFTEADADRATAVAKEHATTSALVHHQKTTSEALAQAGAGTPTQSSSVGSSGLFEVDAGSGRTKFSGRGGVPLAQGDKTKAYADQIMRAFASAAPAIGGPAVHKALVPSGNITADFDGRVIHDPAATFSILEAVNRREVSSAAGTYLRQTQRVNNAAPVVPGELKPISQYGLEPATWQIATIAHLSEPIKLQWLDDYPALEQFLGQELAYGVDEAIADFILNGGTAEDGSTVSGILNTSGVVQTPFTTNRLLTLRRAIGELDVQGVTPTGIVLNPTDWESIETLTTTTGEFLLPLAPQNSVERRLWNTPVTLAAAMPAGEAIIGDLSTVSLLYRNSQRIEWNPYMGDTATDGTPAIRDLFRRNEVVFRAEIRIGLEILSTKTLRIADLTA
ncbi:phage major capsid protein [Paenarthrobacter sp. CCNWLY172]|uniref:phage major capsid protein n=1 Tax=unclassified Paenarthrobacter TaxID=2634190 RepID=UPI0030772D29